MIYNVNAESQTNLRVQHVLGIVIWDTSFDILGPDVSKRDGELEATMLVHSWPNDLCGSTALNAFRMPKEL